MRVKLRLATALAFVVSLLLFVTFGLAQPKAVSSSAQQRTSNGTISDWYEAPAAAMITPTCPPHPGKPLVEPLTSPTLRLTQTLTITLDTSHYNLSVWE